MNSNNPAFCCSQCKNLTHRTEPELKFVILRNNCCSQLLCFGESVIKYLLQSNRYKNKQLSITSRHLLRQIPGSNYPGTKGHQGGINWIPICAPSHQVSLLGRSPEHAKDSTVVIRSLIAWALYRQWNQWLLIQEGSVGAADQWGADGVLKQWWTPYITAQRCVVQRSVLQSCSDGWLLSALSGLGSSADWVVFTLSLLIPTDIQVNSEGWGSSLKP